MDLATGWGTKAQENRLPGPTSSMGQFSTLPNQCCLPGDAEDIPSCWPRAIGQIWMEPRCSLAWCQASWMRCLLSSFCPPTSIFR